MYFKPFMKTSPWSSLLLSPHGKLSKWWTCYFTFETSTISKVTPELQKRADRADQSVLFFLAGANFWEKHAKNRRKHAKTGEKQALFWC